jgi:hypothetical protein
VGNFQLLKWSNMLIIEGTIKRFKYCLNKEGSKGTYSSSDMEEKFLLEYIYSEFWNSFYNKCRK